MRKPLCGTVLIERAGDAVKIQVLTVRDAKTWVAAPMKFQDLIKRLSKWDRAFFPVYEHE